MNALCCLPRRTAALILGLALAAPLIGVPSTRGAALGARAPGRSGMIAPAHAQAAPALLYATYLGPADSHGTGVATDRAGNVYAVGTSGQIPSSHAWIAKLDPTGTRVLYSVSIGAPCGVLGNNIAVDVAGNAYITGLYGIRDQFNLCQLVTDVLVARIDPSGHIVYQKLIGPTAKESSSVAVTNEGNAIAVDSAGNAYVTGRCDCWAELGPNLPTTPGAFQRSGHMHDGFVLKLDPSGALLYSTILGGSHGNIIDQGNGIAVDSAGNAYVTGSTQSSDFPTTPNAVQRVPGTRFKIAARSNAFLAELDPTGSRLLYGTYLGGGEAEIGYGVALDGAGNVYLTGATDSPNFPVTPNAYDRTCGTDGNCNVSYAGGLLHQDIYFDDAFVAKVAPARAGAAGLIYSTFLGGQNLDQGTALAVDRQSHVWVTGFTASAGNFPTLNPVQQDRAGDKDAFVAELDLARSGAASLLFATYLGGSKTDIATGLALGPHSVYATGYTTSPDFPTRQALQATLAGGSSSFLAKLAR